MWGRHQRNGHEWGERTLPGLYSPHSREEPGQGAQRFRPMSAVTGQQNCQLRRRLGCEAAGKALAQLLRQQRRDGDSRLEAPTRMLASSAPPPSTSPQHSLTPLPATSELDLSRKGLGDKHMIAVTALLANHPGVTSLDMSFNPITDVSGHALVKALRGSKSIVSVNTEETFLSRRTVETLQNAAAVNAMLKTDSAAKVGVRQRRRECQRQSDDAGRKMDVVVMCEKRYRSRIEAARKKGLLALKEAAHSAHKAVLRIDTRNARRRRHSHERHTVCEEENKERVLWLTYEAHCFTKLFHTWGSDSKIAVTASEANARRDLKGFLAECRMIAKQKERTRLEEEYNARLHFEEGSFAERVEIACERCEELSALKETEEVAFAIMYKIMNERLEKEAAEVRFRKQEELRLEKERQIRAEREMRRLIEFQVNQDKEARAEMGRRSTIEREEADARASVYGLSKLDKSVSIAQENLMTAERVRTKAYAAEPTLDMKFDQSLVSKHFIGTQRCATVMTGVRAEADVVFKSVDPLPAPHSHSGPVSPRRRTQARPDVDKDPWSEVAKSVKDMRKVLKARVQEAQEVVRQNLDEWASVLFPQMATHQRGRAHIPEGAKPAVSYDVSSLRFAPLPQEQPKAMKLTVQKGFLEVSAEAPQPEVKGLRLTGPASQFQEDTLQLNTASLTLNARSKCTMRNPEVYVIPVDECPSPKNRAPRFTKKPAPPSPCHVSRAVTHVVVVDIEKGATMNEINSLCNAITYSSGAPHNSAPYERVIRMKLSLNFPALSDKDVEGGVVGANPFSKCVTVTSSIVFSVAVMPSLFVSKPVQPVSFLEGTAPDRCVVLEEPLSLRHLYHVKKLDQGFLFSKNNVLAFDSFELHVKGIIGWTDEDMLLIRTSADDDVILDTTSTKRRLMYDGLAFAEVSKGCLMRCKEVDLDEQGAYAPSDGFELKLFGPESKASNIIKFLEKLRYYNPSMNPGESERIVEISLNMNGMKSAHDIPIKVLAKDDPASMTLSSNRVHFRQGSLSVPEHLRKYLRQIYAPIFDDIKVEDVDTDYFSGGNFTVQMQNCQKGDELLLYPTAVPNVQIEVDSNGILLVSHNGVCMGVLEGGLVFDDTISGETRKYATNSKCDGEVQEMKFRFWNRVPLSSVQHLLRCVCYTSALYVPVEGTRKVSITLLLGESADPNQSSPREKDDDNDGGELTELVDSVELRVVPPLFSVQGSHWKFEYREGSGSVRVAPFEVATEKESMLENDRGAYSNGCVWVEIVEGSCEDDVLNLKTGSGPDELRVDMKKGVKPTMPYTVFETTKKTLPEVVAPTPTQPAISPIRKEEAPKEVLEEVPPEPAPAPAPSNVPKLTLADAKQAEDDDSSDDNDPFVLGTPRTKDSHLSPRVEKRTQESPYLSETLAEDKPTTPKMGTNKLTDLRQRVRDKAQEVVRENAKKRKSIVETTKLGIQQLLKTGVVDERVLLTSSYSEIFLGKSKTKIGMLSLTRAALFVKFPGKSIGRKEVKEVLRNVTYANTNSDASILTKILRVTVRSTGHAPSQSIIVVEIQSVDDVTEIHLANPRPKYRIGNVAQHSIGAWQLGQVTLVDPDTTHLDGGVISLDLQGGGVKGDTLGFLTLQQQEVAKKVNGVHDTQNGYEVELRNGKLLIEHEGLPDFVIGTLDSTKSSVPGANNLKFSIACYNPPKITMELCSYIMSCFTFKTIDIASKVTVGQRAYTWRVRDKENPVEGKERVLIDVAKPLIAPASEKSATKNVARGASCTVTDKTVVSVGDSGAKKDTSLTHGALQVHITGEVPKGALSLQPPATQKDGGVNIGNDFVGKMTIRSTCIRVEFGWASKATAKNLAALVSSIHYKAPDEECSSVVHFQCSDHNSECCFQVTMQTK